MEKKLIVSLHANNKGMELKPVHNNGKNFNTITVKPGQAFPSLTN